MPLRRIVSFENLYETVGVQVHLVGHTIVVFLINLLSTSNAVSCSFSTVKYMYSYALFQHTIVLFQFPNELFRTLNRLL